jgi:hypothetical protein
MLSTQKILNYTQNAYVHDIPRLFSNCNRLLMGIEEVLLYLGVKLIDLPTIYLSLEARNHV